MQNPETGPREPEQEVTQNDPLEVLREGREDVKKSPRMKELRERLRSLSKDHIWLDRQYNFNEGGVRRGTIKSLSKEAQEEIKQKVGDLSEQLDKNEAEQAEIRKEIEKIEDEIKGRISLSIKAKINKN
ncbi:MAG: hypothetical protein HYT36_01460 [Candidatus Staskawiczbacteria bacterium]|nr:hypothetical protein [Candidatus Staskawiczbacteria bacterium]